jgi:aminoglycoside phosphotransferase (APT) family kinase protein
MITTETQKQIIKKAEELLKIKIVDLQIPVQGIDSEVLLVTDTNGNEFIVKFGANAINDVIALNLIKENKLDVPVPKMLGYFPFDNKTVVILEKIFFPLLVSVSKDQRADYIGSMIANLVKIHSIKSNIAGHVNNQDKEMLWKEFMLFKYSGKHPWFDWEQILYRDGVDTKLVKDAIVTIVGKIKKHTFLDAPYSLLHTDFNPRNLFISTELNKITGIVDWADAVFGDPIYDFARVRMFIWHSDFKHNVLENYYKLLGLTNEEKKLEELYFLSTIIEYITWFSATKNEFRILKLKAHQDFLRAYKWR